MSESIQKTVEQFFLQYPKHSYKRGEVILRAEDPPAGIMYLKKGHVRMYVISENGEMLVLHVFKPGSFFPMMWALNGTPNRYFFDAIVPVELYRAPREAVQKLIVKRPDILYDFTSRLLLGTSGLLQRMEHLVLESAYVKTIRLLLYFAKNFSEETHHGTMVSLTHREVAVWIGTTRETASLQIEDLKRKDLLSYQNRKLVLPDADRLEAEMRL